MYDINTILDMLRWDNPPDIQKRGMELAQSLSNYTSLILPISEKINKNVWDNCAKVICNKSDADIFASFSSILEWLQDLNWPGSIEIRYRLLHFEDKETFVSEVNKAIKKARDNYDEIWEDNLRMLLEDYQGSGSSTENCVDS